MRTFCLRTCPPRSRSSWTRAGPGPPFGNVQRFRSRGAGVRSGGDQGANFCRGGIYSHGRSRAPSYHAATSLARTRRKRKSGNWPVASLTAIGISGAGAGMAQVLRIAQEKQAYTLADRGTFLALGKELELVILLEGDPLLRNDYAVMITSIKKHAHVNAAAAQQFADFLTEPATQKLIAEFGVDKFGEPLFFPRK